MPRPSNVPHGKNKSPKLRTISHALITNSTINKHSKLKMQIFNKIPHRYYMQRAHLLFLHLLAIKGYINQQTYL